MIRSLDELHELITGFDRFTEDEIEKVYLSAYITRYLETGRALDDKDWAPVRKWVSEAQANAAILAAIAAGGVEFEVVGKGRVVQLRGAREAHRQLQAPMWEQMRAEPAGCAPPAALRELAKIIQFSPKREQEAQQ